MTSSKLASSSISNWSISKKPSSKSRGATLMIQMTKITYKLILHLNRQAISITQLLHYRVRFKRKRIPTLCWLYGIEKKLDCSVDSFKGCFSALVGSKSPTNSINSSLSLSFSQRMSRGLNSLDRSPTTKRLRTIRNCSEVWSFTPWPMQQKLFKTMIPMIIRSSPLHHPTQQIPSSLSLTSPSLS